jgi:hypothetical protein
MRATVLISVEGMRSNGAPEAESCDLGQDIAAG